MNLNEVNDKVKAKPNCHRIGRGPGSGWGTTAGRGMNGAQCRSGWKAKAHFEGGQMSIARRIPKRGFNNKIFGNTWSFVNLSDLNIFEDGETVTPELCLERHLIPSIRSGLKVLGQGTLEKKLTIRAHRASKSAVAAIEAAGSTLELIAAQGDNAKSQWQAKRHKGKKSVRRQAAIKRSGN